MILSWVLPVAMVTCVIICALAIAKSIIENKALIILTLFLTAFIFNVLLGLFIKVIRLNIKNRIQTAETIAANSKTELQLLQSQLSPHFLFNTLNNMYGISMSEHEKIPPLLLKLSDLLRYSVYDAKELFVPLKEEISYLNNYIDFEKIRIGERLQLTLSMEDVRGLKLKIAPMLLIVFVENAFKHSKNTNNESIAINISLKIWDDSVLFSVKNSQGVKEITANTLNKNSGLGLANVKKRLELLYPNQYDLQIDDSEESYRVMLRLNLKSDE